MTWLPKLGEVLKKPEDVSAARRFEEAGFDLHLTLQQRQTSEYPGDKNNEERQLRSSKGPPDMKTDQAAESHATSAATGIPPHILQQVEALRASGATVGIPLVVQFDERTLSELGKRAEVMPLGADLARFSAKAGIATVLALGAGIAFWVVTKPAEPML